MSLQLQMAIEGNLDAYMKLQVNAVSRAVTGAVRAVTFGLQKEIKHQIGSAGFKKRGLQKLVFSKVSPKHGYLPDAEGLVYTHADVKRKSGNVDLIEAYDKGAVITAGSGRWLAIPTKKAPNGNKTKADPRDCGLDLVARPTKNPSLAMLVKKTDKGPKFVVYYWLVKQVTLRKRINIQAAKDLWLPQIETRINTNLDLISEATGIPL